MSHVDFPRDEWAWFGEAFGSYPYALKSLLRENVDTDAPFDFGAPFGIFAHALSKIYRPPWCVLLRLMLCMAGLCCWFFMEKNTLPLTELSESNV